MVGDGGFPEGKGFEGLRRCGRKGEEFGVEGFRFLRKGILEGREMVG